MNKVYKFSKNVLKMSIPLSVILGISSCATYQSSQQVESDGVYYNPSVDKTYADIEAQNSVNNGDIRVGAPYFDANGNGAEEIFYGDDTTETKAENVNVNIYGSNYGFAPLGTGLYSSLSNDSNWGRNDGVNITIYNNPFMWNRFGFGYGFGWNNWNTWGMYNPWNWGFDPYYNSMWGWNGFYGNYWSWNRPWYNGYYGGWGFNRPWYNGYYGGNWGYNRPNYNNGYFQNNIINSRPGNRPSRELINTMPAGRENVLSRPGTTNRPSREVRPSTDFNSNNAVTRPTREVRPSTDFNSNNAVTRPTREVKPSTDFNSNNAVTRPTREVRPSREFNSNNATTSPNRGNANTGNRETRPMRQPSSNNRQSQYPTQQSRPQIQDRGFEGRTPTYSSPSPRMSSPSTSMSSGSSTGGSRSGGSGRR